MPEGYEKLRDALKRQGKSDEEAKRLAAAIWNKHHKDNPVTNQPHEELGGNVEGNAVMGGQHYSMDYNSTLEGTGIFLGLPENAAFKAGQKKLDARLAELLKQDVARFPKARNVRAGGKHGGSGYVSAPSSQMRSPLSAPVESHPTGANPNPNARAIPDPTYGAMKNEIRLRKMGFEKAVNDLVELGFISPRGLPGPRSAEEIAKSLFKTSGRGSDIAKDLLQQKGHTMRFPTDVKGIAEGFGAKHVSEEALHHNFITPSGSPLRIRKDADEDTVNKLLEQAGGRRREILGGAL